MENIRFGVNYVPGKRWNYAWLDYHEEEIVADLKAIKSLGADHIRIHLLWEYFQPNPNHVSESCMDHLVNILDIAESFDLDVQVTVLDGWLCGYIYVPAWVKDANVFTSREVIHAQKELFRVVAERIGNHKAFMGFDLGNELCVLHYGHSRVTQAQADAWNQEMITYVQELLPGKFHVNGVDHAPWFADFSFTRKALANTGSATSIHSWILFTGAMKRYHPLDIGCTHLLEYNIEFAKAYAQDLSRPIWIEEFGINKNWLDEEKIPLFMEKAFESALSCSNVWGLSWWCSHNIDRRFVGFDPLEYDMGLIDIHNNVKANGLKFRELVEKYRNNPPVPLTRSAALVFPDDYFRSKIQEGMSVEDTGWTFGKHFMDLLEQGEHPAIVLQSKVDDGDYLKARGITKLIEME